MVFGLFRKNSNDGMDPSSSNKKKDKSAAALPSSAAAAVGGGQTETRPGYKSIYGCTALVTGSSGMCGARLVEMLLERGAKTVICFDLKVPDATLQERFDAAEKTSTYKKDGAAGAGAGKLIYCHGRDHGDLTSDAAVEAAFFQTVVKHQQPIDVCFHIAALVGPFFDPELYYAVNYHGTIRILEMCKKYKVPKLVYSSSPSTRFTGADVTGQREEELPIPETWLAMYAETKAKGEQAVSAAHGTRIDSSTVLQTISVAPHQVYGPHDALMLPNLLETAGHGLLRIFGSGLNKISVCFADNYAHGLLCGADALNDKDKETGLAKNDVGGKFYIITDGEPVYFWKFINQAVLAMGFADIEDKFHLPTWLLYGLAYICNVVGWMLGGKKFKLNPFNVRMLTIHRYFSIENAQRDLHYQPVMSHDQAWALTIRWFQDNWLPGFSDKNPNIKVNKKPSTTTDAESKKKD